jgi:hypothetical protein
MSTYRGDDDQVTKEQVLLEIAKKHLGLKTLDEQKHDHLDFHSLAVWSIKDALEAAFEAGSEPDRSSSCRNGS